MKTSARLRAVKPSATFAMAADSISSQGAASATVGS